MRSESRDDLIGNKIVGPGRWFPCSKSGKLDLIRFNAGGIVCSKLNSSTFLRLTDWNYHLNLKDTKFFPALSYTVTLSNISPESVMPVHLFRSPP